MNALDRILAYKRDEVAAARAKALPPRDTDPPRGFAKALNAARTAGRMGLIAEVKKASPSKGLIRADFDPAGHARAYAAGGATCLSVLTDGPSFQGSPDALRAARAACALPVLRKDFLIDPWQVAEAHAMGADAVLIIMAAVDDVCAADLAATAREHGLDTLVEVHNAAEMDRALALEGIDLIGVNNRDLTRFVTDLAVTETLAAKAGTRTLVSESGIASSADVARVAAAGAHAVLVGESLMRHDDVEAATRRLMSIESAF